MSEEVREAIALKPCPFCGGDDVAVLANAINCLGCGGGVHIPHWYQGMDGSEAIEAWNRRAPLIALCEGNSSARDLAPTITDARVSCDARHAETLKTCPGCGVSEGHHHKSDCRILWGGQP